MEPMQPTNNSAGTMRTQPLHTEAAEFLKHTGLPFNATNLNKAMVLLQEKPELQPTNGALYNAMGAHAIRNLAEEVSPGWQTGKKPKLSAIEPASGRRPAPPSASPGAQASVPPLPTEKPPMPQAPPMPMPPTPGPMPTEGLQLDPAAAPPMPSAPTAPPPLLPPGPISPEMLQMGLSDGPGEPLPGGPPGPSADPSQHPILRALMQALGQTAEVAPMLLGPAGGAAGAMQKLGASNINPSFWSAMRSAGRPRPPMPGQRQIGMEPRLQLPPPRSGPPIPMPGPGSRPIQLPDRSPISEHQQTLFDAIRRALGERDMRAGAPMPMRGPN